MKISGNDKYPIARLELNLASVNTSLVHYMYPFTPDFPDDDGEYDSNAMRARIEFHDSREIDTLIDMLELFRKKNREYIGEWREC